MRGDCDFYMEKNEYCMKKTGRISKITDMDLFACYNETN